MFAILSVAFLIYVFIGAITGSPIFGSDEYAYFIQGKYQHLQTELIRLDPYLQQIGSPLFLYMLHWLAKIGLDDFTGVVRIIHAAEYCLTAYILVQIFQDVCSRRNLVSGLIVFLLLPGACYMLAVMPEMELLLISALVAYVLVVLYPGNHFQAAVYVGMLLGMAILIKPHALAIIASAFSKILVTSFLGLPKGTRVNVAAKVSLIMFAAAYLTFIVLWWVCEKEWVFDPSVALGLNLYGNQLAVNTSMLGWLHKFIETLHYASAHIAVLVFIFAPAFMSMAGFMWGGYLKIRARQEFAISINDKKEMAILFVGLLLFFHIFMSAYFTAGAAALNQGEAMRLQGRYLGSAIIFLPFLYFLWLGRPRNRPGRLVVVISLLAGVVCYFWIFQNFKIYPWDHPLLYGFFTYPNHYGWGFDSGLPFVGKWLLLALLASYLITLFRIEWIKPFLAVQVFVVVIVGAYQTSNWLIFHTLTSENLSGVSRAISRVLDDSKASRGVFISDERYGSMSYVLYGLATAPKVIVRAPKNEVNEADVHGYDWVLMGKKYVPKFFYTSEIEFDRFKLYLINSKIVTHEREKELLLYGKETSLSLAGGIQSSRLRLDGFNVREEWGAITSESRARLELPFLINGTIRIRVFGWIPQENPVRSLLLSAGGVATDILMQDTAKEYEVTMKMTQPTDSITLEIPVIHPPNSHRDMGVAIGYIKIEVLTE